MVSVLVVVLIVIFALFAGVYAPIAIVCNRRWRKRLLETAASGPEHKEWVKRLQPQIALRIEQERDTSRGRGVWFSRHIEHGRWKHWILIIDDVKYELRQNHVTKGYHVNVAPCPLDHERRQAAIAKKHFPEYDGHYVCLIGWTRKSRSQIEDIARQEEPWDYHRFTNNCQHFLRLLADQILEKDKAADYQWFYDNTQTEYLNSRQPPLPPEVIKAMQTAQLSMITHHHQHQMNMLNMQLANQALFATNPALNAANNPAMNFAMNPAMNPAIGGFGGGGC